MWSHFQSQRKEKRDCLELELIGTYMLSNRKLLIKLSVTNFRVLSQDKPMTFPQQDALKQSYRRPELLGHIV